MVLTQQRPHLPRDPDKFPATQLFLLALVRVAEPIALTSILPYAWKLVLNFHVGDKSNASFYAGLLISAFALSEAVTAMLWGGLSDRIGRRPVLLMGCLGTMVSLLVVGFSMNFWMALFGRLLGGALNGNIGVIQTMVGELVTNPKHEPKAYAVMPFVWSVGTIVGPCIGGYFAQPAESYPDIFAEDGVFGRFPYLLPNLLCAVLMAISIVVGYLCLEETHPDLQPREQFAPSDPPHPKRQRADSTVMTMQPTDATPAANLAHESYGTFNAIIEDEEVEEWHIKADGTSRPSSLHSDSRQKWLTYRVLMLNIALGIFTYHSMTFDHLLPIFLQDDRVEGAGRNPISVFEAMTSNDIGSLAGGLGLSVKECGFIMAINGAIALFVQAVIFPNVAGWLGVWRTFLVVTILHPIAYFIVPWVALLPIRLTYAGIFSCLAVRNVLSILAYPVLLILLKEASPRTSCLGKINGLAASTGAACRTVAAPIAGSLYGLGINIDFVAIAWWGSALVAIAGAVQALMIRRDDTTTQHTVRSAASCRFLRSSAAPESLKHKPSVVRIRVSEDERRPLISDEN